jgi:hypothetical protein
MIRKLRRARRAQGIGSGIDPESDFKKASKPFICAGNKNNGAVFSLAGRNLPQFSAAKQRRPYENTHCFHTGARAPQSTPIHRLAIG